MQVVRFFEVENIVGYKVSFVIACLAGSWLRMDKCILSVLAADSAGTRLQMVSRDGLFSGADACFCLLCIVFLLLLVWSEL